MFWIPRLLVRGMTSVMAGLLVGMIEMIFLGAGAESAIGLMLWAVTVGFLGMGFYWIARGLLHGPVDREDDDKQDT